MLIWLGMGSYCIMLIRDSQLQDRSGIRCNLFFFFFDKRCNLFNHSLMSPIYPFQDNKDLYAEEAAAQRERERQRMLSIPGLIAPNEIQDEMVDS